MSQLQISSDLALPLDTVTSTLVVYGGKGMGKTNLLSVLLEEMSKARLRWCALDPVGVLWGLRHAADGQGDGVECLILGGVHGDIAIYPDSGEIVADLVADNDVNVIVDCSRNAQGQMWSVGERTRFLTAFARRIFQRQGSLIGGRRREPLFVALDEAARYIPEQIPHGNPDLSASVGAWEQLVEEGRNVGIGVGLFTQRSARLKKSVAELADVMMAFRTVGPRSIDAVMDWLGEHVPKAHVRELIERLRQIAVGTALVVSPGWLRFEDVVAIRARETFDSSETPKPGQRARRVSGRGAVVDLKAYEALMAETVARAKDDDPKELHKKIRRLEAALSKAEQQPAQTVAAEPTIVHLRVDVVPADVTAMVDRARQALRGALDGLGDALDLAEKVNAAAAESETPVTGRPSGRPQPTQPAPRAQSAVASARPAAPTVAPAAERRPAGDGDTTLGKTERTILAVLVQHGPRTHRQLALQSGYSPKASTIRVALGKLRRLGYVEPNAPIAATAAGVDALGDYEPLPTGPALLAFWQRNLDGTSNNVLSALLDFYPDDTTLAGIADVTGYSPAASTIRVALGKLRRLELVDGWRISEDFARSTGLA